MTTVPGRPPTTPDGRPGARPRDAAASEAPEIGYEELRDLARHLLARRGGGLGHATSLAHETWIRLARGAGLAHPEREHGLAIAARAMRCVLVDHARRRAALKRAGPRADVPLDALDGDPRGFERVAGVDCLALHEALERLAAFDERKARVVELRFFGGLEIEETAEVLAISPATVKRDWLLARAWLWRELCSGEPPA